MTIQIHFINKELIILNNDKGNTYSGIFVNDFRNIVSKKCRDNNITLKELNAFILEYFKSGRGKEVVSNIITTK
jgi:hypothetical protein